jgi:hypothetical protein
MDKKIFTTDIADLFPFIETIAQDGGYRIYATDKSQSIYRLIDGMSGYTYKNQELEASLGFGIILGGLGFVLRRKICSQEVNSERYDHFDVNGKFTFTSEIKSLEPLLVDNLEMDLSCPILNHLYNFLALEYRNAQDGKSQVTVQVHTIEKFLRTLYSSKLIKLPIQNGINDSAIKNLYAKISQTELDPVLTWEERQIVFSNIRSNINKILKTKIRAHKLSALRINFSLFKKNLHSFVERLITRPLDNLGGLLYRYTIGKVLWFFRTVKNNLGYSIALAVYGPFTYYFITMPMNPHAMQAVGRVRSAYLETKQEIFRILDTAETSAKITTVSSTSAAIPPKNIQDEIHLKSAAPVKVNQQNQILNNIIYNSNVTSENSPVMINVGDGKSENIKPQFLNMILTTDIPLVDQVSWNERMSNFKQMQIAYEENIEFASRMGRLEQLETQYNFPMQIESTWEELERYNNYIFKIRQENPNLTAKMKQYLLNEVNRTQQLQLYLWDRMSRFILDQIYVMLDQDNEQKRNDYYVGRSFVFMQEMTNVLTWRYKNFKKPQGFERIEKLANFYSKNRKEFGSVLKNLTANSDLYKQKDLLSTQEFRSYMKRQWEILYLQNSKAEEASNNGLNMYIWSVRNTAWVLQSLYSAKRDELSILIKRDTSGQMLSPPELLNRSKLALMYETLIHNLTLEYVGIREEIKNRLGKDIESTQRMMVLENLKEFLIDREKLDGTHIAESKTTAGNTL